MGIPMVMDLSPSATQLMEYGEDGYYAYYTESWEACLRRLASDASHRQKIGQNMKARFQLRYSPSAQNKLFSDYIHHLMHSPCSKA
jgi:glycosyltransferase involved in cell wall biosynthesis